MEKVKWIVVVLTIGVVLNLLLLDWQFFELRDDLWQIQSRLREVSYSKIGLRESQEDGFLSLMPTPTLAKTPEVAICSQPCLQEIEKIRSDLAKITPGIVKEVQKTETVVSQSSAVKEFFVPFGSGKTTSRDWEDVSGLNAYLDSNNYQNIKSVKFEASLRIPTANGTVYARLYNETDKHPVWNSEVSSEGPTATLKQSGNINLDSGNKLYKVQMKTSMKFESLLDSARVKIIVE